VWTNRRSLILSLACTKAVIVLVVAFAAFLPFLRGTGFFSGSLLLRADSFPFVAALLYAVCVPAMVALLCLHRVLARIRRDEIFTAENVRLLRVISWSCFAACFVLLAGSASSIAFALVGVGAGFAGLIVRVVKNVFDAARLIKDENDFTI
jgi:hypothetical protein